MLTPKFCTEYEGIKSQVGNIPEEPFKVTTNSKELGEATFFIALKGERFDAYDFIEDVLGTTVKVVAYNHTEEREKQIKNLYKKHSEVAFIGVDDTTTYLQELAKKHIREWQDEDPKRALIAVTGSNGKTTTKEMLHFFMNALHRGKVYSTTGNYNNHIGVPLTLLQISKKHMYAIVEMGTNHPGEIQLLCEIANPTAGIITNIGDSHLEFFKDQKGVFEEKRYLYDFLNKKTSGEAPFVVDGDDDYLINLPHSNGLLRYGEDAGEILVEVFRNSITVFKGKKEYHLKNDYLTGKHNLKNLACAFIMASHYKKGAEDQLQRVAKNFKPQGNRSVWMKKDSKDIYLDAYNANPSSMKAALQGFVAHCKNKNVSMDTCLFVVGDMNELGEKSGDLHEEVGKFFKSKNISNIVYIGKHSGHFSAGFGSEIKSFLSSEEFMGQWDTLFKQYDYFFLKASRTLQLESLLGIN